MEDMKGRLLQKEKIDEFLSGIDTFFFDCDGEQGDAYDFRY